MTERISMILPELNPEVIDSNKRKKNSWLKSDFAHIGSTKNGSFTREWNLLDFRNQIKYLKTSDDPIFYLRVILQDSKMRDIFVKKLDVSPDEFWHNSYEHEEDPNLTRDEYMKKYLWKALAVDAEIQGVLKDLPDDFLLETLKVYNQEIGRIRDESLEKISEMRPDFMTNFENFTQKYNLQINWDEIQQKFGTISYDLFDQYYSDMSPGRKIGDYDKDSHTVRVEMSPFSRVSFDTLQHEHIHAISGRKNDLSLIDFGDNKIHIGHSIPRLGAAFERSSAHPGRFEWLNEAITEEINIDIKKDVLKKDKHFSINDSYPDERQLFKLIIAGGQEPIAARLFYQAYFESETENPKDLKHRQELYQEISAAYGSPRFLIEIDDMIKKIGLKETIKIFKSSGQVGIREWWSHKFVEKNGRRTEAV